MENSNKHYNNPIELCEKNFTHTELIEFIKFGNIIEKQYAVLNLDCIKDKDEAHLLLKNLVGVDGKIREAVSFRLRDFMSEKADLFDEVVNYDLFIQATIDIDGNVCRNVISSVCYLINNSKFRQFYAEGLSKIIDEALDTISKFTYKDKKYKVNKQIFKIYWCLEALTYFYQGIGLIKLKEHITRCSKLSEYTIREKCAKILKIIPKDIDMSILVEELKKDDNYYVRKVLCNN